MLSRYTIYRRRPANAGPLPDGIRQDTRYRTKHILRPSEDIVEAYLADPTDAAWRSFRESTLRSWSSDPERIARRRRACKACHGQRCVSRMQLPNEEEPCSRPLPHVPGPGIHEEEVPDAQSRDPRDFPGGLKRKHGHLLLGHLGGGGDVGQQFGLGQGLLGGGGGFGHNSRSPRAAMGTAFGRRISIATPWGRCCLWPRPTSCRLVVAFTFASEGPGDGEG